MKNNKNSAALEARYEKVQAIDVHAIRQMYHLYARYYENTCWEIFLKDLSNKTGAFILRNAAGRVVGFSTVKVCDVNVGGRSIRGVFSGDTIIERAYWGNRALQLQFFKFLIAQKMANPTRAIYWFLISKGFKTYLLLANNFFTFYPRPDRQDHYLADIVDAYCEQLFPEYYRKDQRILDFGEGYQPLKDDVADITDVMRQENEHIRFFEDRNPEWRRGTELPCVGEIRWADLAKFTVRYLKKPESKGRQDSIGTAPGRVVVPLRSVKT